MSIYLASMSIRWGKYNIEGQLEESEESNAYWDYGAA